MTKPQSLIGTVRNCAELTIISAIWTTGPIRKTPTINQAKEAPLTPPKTKAEKCLRPSRIFGRNRKTPTTTSTTRAETNSFANIFSAKR